MSFEFSSVSYSVIRNEFGRVCQGLAEADAMTQAFHVPMLLVYFLRLLQIYFQNSTAATPLHASEMAGNRFYGLLNFKICRGRPPRTLLNGLAPAALAVAG